MGKNRLLLPAVIATMSYSGLALSRSLGRRGVKVYAIGTSKNEVGMSSRYVNRVLYPHITRSDDDTVKALLDLATRIGKPAVLFPTGDSLVLPISRNREILSKHYRFLMPEKDVVELLVSKEGLSKIIAERNLPGPRSVTLNHPSEIDNALDAVTFPVLMKPVYSASWYMEAIVRLIGNRKVIICNDSSELFSWYGKVSTVDPRVVLQELIPGDDPCLYYVCGYFDSSSNLTAIFAGQKVRVTPVHFGSASFVVSVRDEKLLKAAKDLLQPMGYKGLFGVEFKKDPRDGVFKIIEVNARWGLWDGLSKRCGMDIGFLAYSREAKLPFDVSPDYRTGVKWVSFRRDLEAFMGYHREGMLSFGQWSRSLLGDVEHAVFAWDDLRPALVESIGIFKEKWKGLVSNLK